MKPTLFQIIRSRFEHLVVIFLTVTLIAVIITIATTPKYEGHSRILVIQKQQSIDAFTASKSADYIAGLLNEAVYSKSFFDSLTKRDTGLASHFSSDPDKRSKEWAKMVDSRVDSGKGILEVKVYDADSKQAQHVTDLIVATLVSDGASYYGGSSDISMRVIDAPSVSTKPARPSFVLNIGGGILVGLALDLVYIFIIDLSLARKLEEREYNGRLHEENEIPQDIEFLADGHVAAQPTQHVVSENFEALTSLKPFASEDQPMQTPPQAQTVREVPLPDDAASNIQNWMRKE